MTVQLKCLSHTPLRGQHDPGAAVVAEVDAVTARMRAEVDAFDPQLVVLFATDHFNGLFYDLMPPFVIAAAASSVGDYGLQAGPLAVPADVAGAMAQHILDSDVDVALSHRLQIDHGGVQTLVELAGSLTRYPVVPIVINCAAPPLGPYRRIRRLGEAVGRFVAGLDQRVLIVGSGGLSHEPPIPLLAGAPPQVAEALIAGRNPSPEARAARQARTIAVGKTFGTPECALTPLNPDWDRAFMQLLADGRLSEVDRFDIDEISKAAGRSAHEVRTWIAAFAALQSACGAYEARVDYYRAINQWIAGYGVMSAQGARLPRPA